MRRLPLVFTAVLAAVCLSACGSGSSDSPSGSEDAATVKTPSTESGAPPPQPFNVSGYLAGNVKPTFTRGEPGDVSVVAQGRLAKDGSGAASLPVAYRNNTSKSISHVDLSATARANGTLVASGQSQGATPAQIRPGEVGFAFLYFENSKSLPDSGVKYSFTADTQPADKSSYNTAPLKVVEATANGSAVIGTAENKTGKATTGPYDVQVYCFVNKKLTSEIGSFGDQDGDVAAGGTVSFTADFYGKKCQKFTVGVSGYFQ